MVVLVSFDWKAFQIICTFVNNFGDENIYVLVSMNICKNILVWVAFFLEAYGWARWKEFHCDCCRTQTSVDTGLNWQINKAERYHFQEWPNSGKCNIVIQPTNHDWKYKIVVPRFFVLTGGVGGHPWKSRGSLAALVTICSICSIYSICSIFHLGNNMLNMFNMFNIPPW